MKSTNLIIGGFKLHWFRIPRIFLYVLQFCQYFGRVLWFQIPVYPSFLIRLEENLMANTPIERFHRRKFRSRVLHSRLIHVQIEVRIFLLLRCKLIIYQHLWHLHLLLQACQVMYVSLHFFCSLFFSWRVTGIILLRLALNCRLQPKTTFAHAAYRFLCKRHHGPVFGRLCTPGNRFWIWFVNIDRLIFLFGFCLLIANRGCRLNFLRSL